MGEVELVGYADELRVVTVVKTEAAVCDICTGMKAKGLSIVLTKTEIVLICKRRQHTPAQIVVEGTTVRPTNAVRIMGIEAFGHTSGAKR